MNKINPPIIGSYIEYDGKKYKTRTVRYEEHNYTIADIKLQDALIKNDKYKCKLAKNIDESIAYYCDTEELQKPTKELRKIIFE